MFYCITWIHGVLTLLNVPTVPMCCRRALPGDSAVHLSAFSSASAHQPAGSMTASGSIRTLSGSSSFPLAAASIGGRGAGGAGGGGVTTIGGEMVVTSMGTTTWVWMLGCHFYVEINLCHVELLNCESFGSCGIDRCLLSVIILFLRSILFCVLLLDVLGIRFRFLCVE